MKAALDITYRYARRIVIGIVGATVLLVGVIMIVTPGPAFVVIPIGLAILGLEFAWARRWLQKVRERISEETSKRRTRNAALRRGDKLDP
ncbi:MAG: PGPGW domain-containing protein [Woeseia sp.]